MCIQEGGQLGQLLRGDFGFQFPWLMSNLPFPLQEQNGDTHHTGDWRGPGRDSLPLPVRSRKYQEGSDATERRLREGSQSPLDSADVRVQVPRTVGTF